MGYIIRYSPLGPPAAHPKDIIYIYIIIYYFFGKLLFHFYYFIIYNFYLVHHFICICLSAVGVVWRRMNQEEE